MPSSEDFESSINLDQILIGATQRGLSLEGISKLDIGQVVDFVMEYSNESTTEEEIRIRTKKASQNDWDAFLG